MIVQFFIRYTTQFSQKLQWVQSFEKEKSDVILDMQYLNAEWWTLTVHIEHESIQLFTYKYQVVNEENDILDFESIEDRRLSIFSNDCKIYDHWFYAGAADPVLSSGMFKNIFSTQVKSKTTPVKNTHCSHLFKVKCQPLDAQFAIGILGNIPELGNWDEEKMIVLEEQDGFWQAAINLKAHTTPFSYKYILTDTKISKIVLYETGDNRVCFDHAMPNETIVMQDGFIRLSLEKFRAAGVSIPVFSLRTNKSFGVGEFLDLKLLTNWCDKTGLKLIQLLPINDTIATYTKSDSYPYAAISAFALHPLYIHIERFLKDEKSIQLYKNKKKQLNALEQYDYENVIHLKLMFLRQYFEQNIDQMTKSIAFKNFCDNNAHWLKAYAVFSYLRDEFKTADNSKWKQYKNYNPKEIESFFQATSSSFDKVQFYCFLQMLAHQQLTEVVNYAHKKGIVLKGDLPIGVGRFSSDTWMQPALFNMNMQAGAPPDDFAIAGQNWGFPTYNWALMAKDNYAWWQQRLQQMSQYFDAYRIDHILGFFRIWSIPYSAVQGVLGSFVPAIPIAATEFGEKSIMFNEERFCQPFISEEILFQVFGNLESEVKDQFLEKDIETNHYRLKEKFDTQRKVVDYFEKPVKYKRNKQLKEGLLQLLSNIILIKDDDQDAYHFRIDMHRTLSYQHLDTHTQVRLKEMYIDYYYKKQEHLWQQEALKKLPVLKKATDMLICGEDLGMVPACVPDVMEKLALLSLEVQRMPKYSNSLFVPLHNIPYLSVVTPSTHDMSTIREWWEEDRCKTQKYYNDILEMSGEAPRICESWMVRAIIMQHLNAPAMWSIFQIQDILSMDDEIKNKNPRSERINQPADAHHYWGYRMHITLENLLKKSKFNTELKDYIKNSGR